MRLTLKNKIYGLALCTILTSLSCDDSHKSNLEKKISEGINYSVDSYNNKNFNIIKIDANKTKNYDFEIKNLEKPGYVKNIKEDAILIMNASLFRKERIIGLVRSNNKNINSNEKINGSGYLAINQQNINIYETTPDTTKYEFILQSYPILIKEGQKTNVKNGKKSFRFAVALDYENNIYFISTPNTWITQRISLEEFSDYLKQKNFKHALNLDGGKSLQIQSNAFSQNGLRKIKNVLYIKNKN